MDNPHRPLRLGNATEVVSQIPGSSNDGPRSANCDYMPDNDFNFKPRLSEYEERTAAEEAGEREEGERLPEANFKMVNSHFE